MNFQDMFHSSKLIMMEGAIGERLKTEFHCLPDSHVALASYVYNAPKQLETIYTQYINISNKYNVPIMITTPTRKANKENIKVSRYSENIILDNVLFLKNLRQQLGGQIYIGGLMGCKGDAYKGITDLTESEAFEFHSWQSEQFKLANVDYLFAGIMPTLSETIGLAKAMAQTNLPYIISFMIRNDGRLLDGTPIATAIEMIDQSVSPMPLCYMTNCVHPDFVYEALTQPFNQYITINNRFSGIQANTALLTPEELESGGKIINATISDFTASMVKLYKHYHFKIFGGCCGTNQYYLEDMIKTISTFSSY